MKFSRETPGLQHIDDAITTPVRPATVPWAATLVSYVRVLKPRETALMVFIGVCSAIVAGGGTLPLARFLLAVTAITAGGGGTNALTNYLDRHVDARMRRTQHRVLPAGLRACHIITCPLFKE